MGFLWVPLGFLWKFDGIPKDSYGIPMGFLWKWDSYTTEFCQCG